MQIAATAFGSIQFVGGLAMMRIRNCLAVAWCLCGSVAFAADIFDRHTLTELRVGIDKLPAVQQMSLSDVARIKPLAANLSSPCIIVKTNDGNLAKALVVWGLRKGAEQPTPVVVLERYVTFRLDRPDLTTAAGKDVMLFPGFGFNFDIGQVVPVNQGADVEFTAEGALKPVGDAILVPLTESLLAPATPQSKHDLLANESVVPQDYAGTWKVDADGRWKGEWELTVDAADRVDGIFISDELQNRYEMVGQIGSSPHNLKLNITLANTQMQVDAFLWTKDKSTMAGTITLVGRKFGFVAQRVPMSP